ncbi:MAG: sulfite exporter TauE/SafE family protein, partial [Alphaproteobacteria bacterium]|nr:sulfite exporter TauE/SafE family protein [Alphaproteobacteria bacterium]
ILGMGFGVGFLSGMFGIGGGFLLTPLLIFYGIPPGVAVATTASQVSAVTFSGVVTHWRRRTVDLKMGAVMLSGGLVGTALGVYLFSVLRRMGQSEFSVSASYVILLGIVGGLMLNESLRTLRAARTGQSSFGRKPGQHNWIHGLPFKMRFRESRLYISAIPPVVLGLVVGVLSAIMGVGGAFMMVPVMIYVLRMPTNVVVGTSLFQVLFVTAAATILHAVDNYTVDIVMALFLILGGVIGVQYGVRVGTRLRGEQLRLLLALLVLAVAARLFFEMVATPADLYTVAVGGP